MSQRTTGAYRLLGMPQIYRFLQEALGGRNARQHMVDSLMCPPPTGRILDLGCGAADVLRVLPSGCTYIGIDVNPRHIDNARTTYGTRGTFLCGDFSLAREVCGDGFDLVIMLGLLHHLDDTAALDAIRLAHGLLARHGRLFTLDPCRVPGQHPIARFLLGRDSGQSVRDEAGYRELAAAIFPSVRTEIHHDLLRVPYSHCIMSCRTTH